MNKKRIALVAGCLLLVLLFAFSGSEAPAIPAVPRAASELPPEYQLTFVRSPEWLKDQQGGNIIASNVMSDPSIVREGGKYRMWFTAAQNAFKDDQALGIAYAESDDGIAWAPRLLANGEPDLLVRPTEGDWDSEGVETASVVKGHDGRYYMYYSGTKPPEGSNNWAIGLAVSDDGSEWTKVGKVLDGNGGWEGPWEEDGKFIGGVTEPSVVYDAKTKTYKMWYSGLGLKDEAPAFRVGYATSRDGVAWTKHPEPVVEPKPGEWDDAVVSHNNVVADPRGGYHLFYFGVTKEIYELAEKKGAAMIPGAIGHAYSPDGIRWKRDANPVLPTIPGTWESWMLGGPTALIEDGSLTLWYFASEKHNAYEFRFGRATANISR